MSEQRDREEYNAQRAAEDDEYDRQHAQHLEALSARVVEAAVREREYERDAGDWNAVEQQRRSRARAAAVDALIAAREGR